MVPMVAFNLHRVQVEVPETGNRVHTGYRWEPVKLSKEAVQTTACCLAFRLLQVNLALGLLIGKAPHEVHLTVPHIVGCMLTTVQPSRSALDGSATPSQILLTAIVMVDEP